LDLVRPLPDLEDLGVGVEAGDLRLADTAVSAVDLDRLGGGAVGTERNLRSPPPSSPIGWSSETKQSSKTSSRVSMAGRPGFLSLAPHV
jgi:hypothetical protein